MIKLENFEVVGWEHAIRGMRNPKNSWMKSDSFVCTDGCGRMTLDEIEGKCGKCPKRDDCDICDDKPHYIIGPNDHELMLKLAKGGPVHAKYRRMITVYVDITAPLYWWKEFDTYKVGTVANSCSTMHKIHAKEFTLEDFSREKLSSIDIGGGIGSPYQLLKNTIRMLNGLRELYLKVKDGCDGVYAKELWYNMIQLLPTSYNQKRTVMLNYEVLHNIYISRKNHKLNEWHAVCDWIESLPYSEIITGEKHD